ncbi:MAG: iron complex outerrane recepter protein [Acidobacteriaceae bacterium]|nr:iron complex outerrane recepter protein [Acidobacteriaceae bacterium]
MLFSHPPKNFQNPIEGFAIWPVLTRENAATDGAACITGWDTDTGVGGGKRRIGLACCVLAVAAVLVLFAAGARAAEQRYEIDIPALPADAALKALARQTKTQLLFPYDLVKTLQANPVTGRYTLNEALEILLQNTGLSSSMTKGEVITISATITTARQGGEQNMNGTRKLSLLGAIAAFLAGGTHAMGADQPASAAPHDELKLEEIVVTAQKRTENLQDVPVSVQVIGSQILARQNHNSLEELTQTIPAVHISAGADQNGSNSIFIRGIGSGSDPSFDQSVAVFTDDIYQGRSRMSEATFLDLDRIEVLKGPQTTFFGNNAIAGALNIVTKKPGDHFDAWARALYGMFGQYAVEGAVGGPITPTFGARLAVTRNGDDRGWIENVSLGEHAPRINNLAGRLTFAFNPSEDLDATLKSEASHHTTAGSAGDAPLQYANCPPPAPLTPDFGGSCATALALHVPIGADNNQNSGLAGQGNSLSTFENVLTLNYRQWGHTFTSVSGMYNYDFRLNVDSRNLPVYLQTGAGGEDYRQFSQEFRVASPTGRPIEYLAGVYFQTDRLDFNSYGTIPVLNFLATIPGLQGLAPYLPISEVLAFGQGEHVYSAFAALTWNATDRMKFNVGLRASEVNKNASGSEAGGTGTGLYSGFVPWPSAISQLVVARFPVFGTGTSPSLSRSDKAWMPSAGIQYKIDPQVMAYFSYTRGFKAGGFEGQQLARQTLQGLLSFSAYGPEYVDAFELGLKSKWLEDRILVNVDVFRGDYKDLQTFANVYIPSLNAFGGEVVNAAKSRSQGLELEGQWAVTRDLRLSANVTYLDSHYVSFPNAPQSTLQSFCGGVSYVLPYCSRFPDPVPPSNDLSGQQTPYAPRWSGSVTASYSLPLRGDYRFDTEVNPYFTSSYWGGTGPDDVIPRTAAYVRLDARVGLESPDRRWTVDLIGKNLTDRIIVTNAQQTIYEVTKEQPRNVALQFRYHFGSR